MTVARQAQPNPSEAGPSACGVRERPVTVRSGEATLAATLALPDGDGPFPGCLLLSGSGPLDRNSNMAGQRLDIARSLAVALAAAGVATLRYDKRGIGESTGDYLTAGFDDEAADAGAALDTLRDRPETTGHVAVIGHSVGATIAMRLVRHPNPPDAYVLLAAAAQSGERVMARQSRRIAETQPIPSRWFRSFVERRHAADRERLMASTTPTLRIRRQTLPAARFRSYMTHDPTSDLSAIDRPVLAITGHNDVQVDPSDVTTMSQLVAGLFDGETPPDLTHPFAATMVRRDCAATPPSCGDRPIEASSSVSRRGLQHASIGSRARRRDRSQRVT